MTVTISILAFLSLLQPVLAQNIAQNFPQFPFGTFYSPEALATFLGVPSDWLGIPKVIYYVIVPFIVAVTVTYGILTELNIFRSYKAGRINIILSIAMSFLLLPSGVLNLIVTYFYAANVFIGLIGFGFLFLIGTIMWIYGRTRLINYEQRYKADIAGNLRNRMKDLHEKERELRKKRIEMVAHNPEANTTEIDNKILAIRGEIDGANDRLHKILHD